MDKVEEKYIKDWENCAGVIGCVEEDAFDQGFDEGFIYLRKGVVPLLQAEKLSNKEFTAIIFMSLMQNHMNYYVSNEESKQPMTTIEIQEELKFSKRLMASVFLKLEKIGLIARLKVSKKTIVLLNPFVFRRETEIDTTTYNLFIGTKWVK